VRLGEALAWRGRAWSGEVGKEWAASLALALAQVK